MRGAILSIPLLAVFALASCTTSPTEVVLLVDGEFATPTEVDHVDVTLVAPSGAMATSTATFDASSPGFPRTIGILQGTGGAGDYTVDVVAKLGNTTVIRRRAAFRFTNNEIRMLRVDLLRVCLGVTCSGERTCGESGLCDRIDVSTTPWTGSPITRFDAGAAIAPIVAP